MSEEFNTLEELYNRIKPALKTKAREMKRQGFTYIDESDIWNYLKEIKWKNSKGLALNEIVSDILNTDNLIIDDYLKEKLNIRDRKLYFNDWKEELK